MTIRKQLGACPNLAVHGNYINITDPGFCLSVVNDWSCGSPSTSKNEKSHDQLFPSFSDSDSISSSENDLGKGGGETSFLECFLSPAATENEIVLITLVCLIVLSMSVLKLLFCFLTKIELYLLPIKDKKMQKKKKCFHIYDSFVKTFLTVLWLENIKPIKTLPKIAFGSFSWIFKDSKDFA